MVSDHHRSAGHPVSNDSGDILVKDMNSQEILPRSNAGDRNRQRIIVRQKRRSAVRPH
jgi:hypothetical protein